MDGKIHKCKKCLHTQIQEEINAFKCSKIQTNKFINLKENSRTSATYVCFASVIYSNDAMCDTINRYYQLFSPNHRLWSEHSNIMIPLKTRRKDKITTGLFIFYYFLHFTTNNTCFLLHQNYFKSLFGLQWK